MFDENQPSSLAGQPTQASGPSGPIRPAEKLPQANQPGEAPPASGAVDIFAETDKAAEAVGKNLPKMVPPKTPAKPLAPAGPLEPLTQLPDDEEGEKGGSKKFLTVGLAVLVLAGIVGGVYYAYSKFFAAKEIKLPELNLNQISPDALNKEFQDDIINLNLNKNSNQEPAELNQNVNQTPESTLDSDKDGLTDEEEMAYGTDISEPDSDGDGLFDKEEVKVYKTNPLDPDTDGDSYLDGDEVKAGYNPNGPGKLLEANFE